MDEKPPERRPLQFGMRTLLELIAVAAFILTLIYYRQVSIQNTGRYQQLDNPRSSEKLVIDTQTGRVWALANSKWIDLGEPPK